MNTADRSIQGSRERAMWSTYRSELLAFARRRLHDDVAAEDLVQDVLTKAVAERGRLRDETRLRPWLFQITRNALIDYYRKAKPVGELPEEPPGESLTPSDTQEELARCMAPMIQRLPAAYRDAVVLSELEGVRQKDVAARLGLSFSGARSRVQRGRERLREMLTDCCDVTLDARGHLMDHECRNGCGCAAE